MERARPCDLSTDFACARERGDRPPTTGHRPASTIVAAGYSAKTAAEQAHRLLMNVQIAAAVETAMAERAKRTEITAVGAPYWDVRLNT